ncbi:hypothetical protein HYV44_00615 [Candidatus Microgenomates bacterium]|nr:hypothetical protein [Candidatus Microgenomates bacterium]
MPEKKNFKLVPFSKWRRQTVLTITSIIILVSFFIGVSMGKKSIQTIDRNTIENITENWEIFNTSQFGFSFRYPATWQLKSEEGDILAKISNTKLTDSDIIVRVSETRSVVSSQPADAIQISIPFGKRSYLIFSTSTLNPTKEVFYTIPMTLEIGN